MALALYRTHRPGSLAEVIGQEHVIQPLARALDNGRIHHAYLFSGPRGCGKTSTARILARSLNCSDGPTATPCGRCRSCVELAPNGPGSIDVVELDAATHRGIDDARELREKAIYAPAASRFKVYIIDEAHQLTPEASNALLKVVEEPPAHLRFIFATTEPDKIIATIRSRTFHYGFRLVPARTLADHMAVVCRAEGVAAEPAALAVVARAGAGSVRDCLSVLGQLIAGAGPAGLTYADAVSALGMTDEGLLDAFLAALAAGSAAQLFTVVDGVISAGHDPRRFVTDVLERLRDLIVLRADPDAVRSGLVDVPEDTADRMSAQAQSLGLAELSRAADLVSAGLTEVKGATAPRLQLELLCARLVLSEAGGGLADLITRIDRLERGGLVSAATAAPPGGASSPEPGPRAASSAPAPAPEPARRGAPPRPARPAPDSGGAGDAAGPAAPGTAPQGVHDVGASARSESPPEPSHRARAEPEPADAEPDDAEPGDRGEREGVGAPSAVARVAAAWTAVLDRVAAGSRVAWTAFHAARPLSLSGGVLAVAVSEPGNVRAIAQRGHDERLRQALIDVLGLDVSIDVVLDPEAAGASGGRARTEPGAKATAAAASPRPSRGAELVRAASGPAAADDPPDLPSEDDPDLSGTDGVALVTRELGARPIGEIDHS